MNDENQPRFGFVNFAETWNGRMAMMGILIGLGTRINYWTKYPSPNWNRLDLFYFFCTYFNSTFTWFLFI